MNDELFLNPPARFADRRLEIWDERLSRPEIAANLEVDWPQVIFSQTFPEMIIHFFERGLQAASEHITWDDDLNALLVNKSVRAVNPEKEAIRFSLALRTLFRRAEHGVGDGYFNSVFFAVLKENGLATHPSLVSLVRDLDYIHNFESNEPSERYQRCRGMIHAAIQAKAYELTKSLGYPLEEAKEILIAALVDYIDRRFSVSLRRQRGLL